MGKRITSLQEITTVTDNDFIPVDNQSSGARKLSAGFLNDIEDALDGKQDALTAGANINIAQDGTISATDTTYTAGTNVDITNGVISATDTNTDTLSELTDTAITTPSNGQTLIYDSTSSKWVNGGVASDIGDLNDVDITSPSNGQVLTYDSVNQEWVNSTPSTGSSNLYGYTVPSSSQGVNGDLYGKIKDITGEDVIEISSTITVNNGNPATINLPRDSSLYDTFTITGDEVYNGSTYSVNQTLNASSIGTSAATATRLGTRTGFSVYKSGASLVFICNSWLGKLSGLSGAYTTDHAVTDIYQNINGSWAKYEDKEGSDVSVTQIQSTGTKIATVTVDNVDTDLYAPTSGSASSYGYTTPSSSSGSDGDIYNKIEDITGTDETVTTPVTISNTSYTFQFPKNITDYSTITISGTFNGSEFPTQTKAITDIGEGQSHQNYVINSSYPGFVWYRTNDSIVVWATNAEITSCYGTYTNSHKIVDIYQKTSNSWSKYEDKGSIVVANPSGTATTDLEKISIDGTIYDIPSGGGATTLAGLTDVDLDTPTDGQGLVYDATNQKWVNGNVGGGGGTGDLSAMELTQNQYNNLPTTQKLDDKELYFINNNITTEEAMDVTDFVNKVESGGAMTITADATNNTLTYVWGGPSTIGANSFYPTVIPSNVTRIDYKITTGTSYSTSDNQFKIGIGVKVIYDATNWAKPTDNNWVTIDTYNTQNTVIEGSLDLSEVDEDTYFYICGHGWNMTIEDLTIVTVNESTDPTKIMYKDVEYGNGGSSGGGNLYGTTAPTSEQGNNGDIYMKYTPEGAPIIDEDYTTGVWSGRIQMGSAMETTVTDFDLSDCYYLQIRFSDISDRTDTDILVNEIGIQGEENPYYLEDAYNGAYLEKSLDGKTLYVGQTGSGTTVILRIDARKFTQARTAITGVYGKVEDKWVGFPEEGYEETTLWEGSQSITQYSVPFTIPDIGIVELNKYDAFAFDFYNSYSIPRLGIMLTSYIKSHKDVDVTLAPDPTDGANPLFMHYDSTNDVLKAYGTTAHGYTLTKVIGIKYGNGGSSSSDGGNLYGTTAPTSDLGNNGDIYMKYDHRYVNTSFISSSTSIPWGSTLDVTITDMDTYDSLHIEGTCMIGGYGDQPFDEEWDVNDISDSSSSPSQVTANSDCYMYRDGDTLKFSNTVTSGTITLLEGAKADAPYIVGEYGKIEGGWCNFPKHIYSTSEQVVGTWIDGKPVYELTFPLAIRCNIPAEQTYDINDYITDGDFLIDYKLYYVNSPNVHDMTGTIPRMQFWKNNNIQYIAYNGLGISAIDFTSTYATFQYTKTTDV